MRPDCTSGFGPVGTNGKRDGGEVELLPLYDELQGHPKLEIIKHYARANVERALAESRAEVAELRAAEEGWDAAKDWLVSRAKTAEARAERLAEALRGVIIAAPGGHECLDFHHDKADRHCADEDCRPLLRWSEAMDAARAALNLEPTP